MICNISVFVHRPKGIEGKNKRKYRQNGHRSRVHEWPSNNSATEPVAGGCNSPQSTGPPHEYRCRHPRRSRPPADGTRTSVGRHRSKRLLVSYTAAVPPSLSSDVPRWWVPHLFRSCGPVVALRCREQSDREGTSAR